MSRLRTDVRGAAAAVAAVGIAALLLGGDPDVGTPF